MSQRMWNYFRMTDEFAIYRARGLTSNLLIKDNLQRVISTCYEVKKNICLLKLPDRP